MSNKKQNRKLVLTGAKQWFALATLFVFASFSTGSTHAAWQISANISGNRITTGEWGSSNEDETIVITQNTSLGENQPGWLFNRDTNTQSPYEFNDDVASIGTGALFVLPIQNNINSNNDKFIGELFLIEPIADFDSIAYDFNIAQNSAADSDHFYLNVYANFGESSPTKFYDCRYNVVPPSGVVGGWTTTTFDPSLTYAVTTHGTSPHPCPGSPADMDTLSPGSSIRVIAINAGDTSLSDLGVSGYFDKVVLSKTSGTITYDFEPVPVELISTETVVLNEIYPNRDTEASSPMNTEWVELYNGTDAAVDVNNWLIRVNSSSHRIDPSCTAAANKMAPMNGASTVIPAGGLLVVEFCNNGAFNKLPNGGADVLLSPGGVGNKVDEHTYPSTAVGKSHQRIPDGGIWVDPEPTPGEKNKVSRQDLIDAGLNEEEIDTIELMLLARGEYFVGEEPVEKSEEAETVVEETLEVEKSENISTPSTGGGGSVGDGGETSVSEESEVVEEPLPAEEDQKPEVLPAEEGGEENIPPAETEESEPITPEAEVQDPALESENDSVETEEVEPATEPESVIEPEPAPEAEPAPEPAIEPDSASSPQVESAPEVSETAE